jgi:hypothetical protein
VLGFGGGGLGLGFMSLSALAAQVAPTSAAAAKNVIECFMVLTAK